MAGYAFRQDARYFVLAERHKSKDTLGVYDAHEAYRLVRVRCPLRLREMGAEHDDRARLSSDMLVCSTYLYRRARSRRSLFHRLATISRCGRAH